MSNDSMPSSRADQPPSEYHAFDSLVCGVVKIPSLAASSKSGENAPWYDLVFPGQRRRISLPEWTPSAFSATAIGTSFVKELCLR